MCKLDESRFHNDEAAREYLEATWWPDGPVCPHCGAIGTAYKTAKTGLYRCAKPSCRMDFTVTVGTVFERSKIALHKWLLAAYLICSSKKGMSARQLHRTIGVTYKTAWFMAHRLREAMKPTEEEWLGSGGGTVEMDETYIVQTHNRRSPNSVEYKDAFLSPAERNGTVRGSHVADVRADTLIRKLYNNISSSSRLLTDDAPPTPQNRDLP